MKTGKNKHSYKILFTTCWVWDSCRWSSLLECVTWHWDTGDLRSHVATIIMFVSRVQYNCSGQGAQSCSSWHLRTLGSQAAHCESWLCFVCWSESEGMSQSRLSQVCEKLSPWQLYETPDVDHDVANDTDDQDDRASRDNRDPVSRNEYLRPVILSSLAPGTEFLWLTFPPLSSHHPAPRTNPLSLMWGERRWNLKILRNFMRA